MRISIVLSVFLVLGISVNSFAAPERYYRYTESNGTLVIKNTISPERAALGYKVLDANGRVVETVAAALSRDALTAQAKQTEQERQQREYDISLLQRYSFVSDIVAAEDRQIAQLNTRAAILRGNLNSFRADMEKVYEQAANYEKQNKPIPDQLQTQIKSLEERIAATEQMLNNQQSEIQNVKRDYSRAIERFKELDVLRGRASSP